MGLYFFKSVLSQTLRTIPFRIGMQPQKGHFLKFSHGKKRRCAQATPVYGGHYFQQWRLLTHKKTSVEVTLSLLCISEIYSARDWFTFKMNFYHVNKSGQITCQIQSYAMQTYQVWKMVVILFVISNHDYLYKLHIALLFRT